MRRCSSCGLLNDAGRETCLGCGATLPLTPPEWHRPAPAPAPPAPDSLAPRPQGPPTPQGELPDAALVAATVVLPGRPGAPTASSPARQSHPTSGSTSSARPRQAAPADYPRHTGGATKERRRRLLPLLLIVIAACAAVAAFVVYRSWADSPATDSASQPMPAPVETRSAASAHARRALQDFFGPPYVSSVRDQESSAYPGDRDALARWTVTTSDGRYTAWLTTASRPVVIRAEAVVLIKTGQRAAQKVAGDIALYERRSVGLSMLDPSPSPVWGESETEGHLTFAWQSRSPGSPATFGTPTLLPRWVSVWVDEERHKLLKYDSLDLATDTVPRPDIEPEKAIEQAVETAGAPQNAEAVLELAPRWDDGGWQPEPTLFWRVTKNPEGARTDADYVFIVARGDDAGDIVDVDEIYFPRSERLPHLEEADEATFDASGPSPVPSGTTAP